MELRPKARDPVLQYGRGALPWMAVGAILGLLIGAGVLYANPPVARSTVVVGLTPISPEVHLSGGRVREVSIDTDAQLLQSDAVLTAVAEAAGRRVGEVRGSLSVTAPELTRVLRVSYVDTSETAAQAGAQAAGEALLQAREDLVLRPVREALVVLDQRLEVPDTASTEAMSTDAIADITMPARRQQAVIDAQLAVGGAGTVLAMAQRSLPQRDNPEVPLCSGMATGGLLGFGVGVLRQRRRSEFTQLRATEQPCVASRERSQPPGRRVLLCGAVAGLVGLAAGTAVGTRLETRPVGEASIVLRPLLGNAYEQRQPDNSVDLATEAQVAISDTVLGRVAAERGVTLTGLRRRVRADVRPGSEVLTVSVRAADRQRAEGLARRTAEALLEVREARATAEVARRSTALRHHLEQAQAAFDRHVTEGGDAAMSATLAQRLVLLKDELRALPLETRAGTLSSTSARGPGLAGLVQAALPWAGLAAGAAVGALVPLRIGTGPRRPSVSSVRLVRRRAWA